MEIVSLIIDLFFLIAMSICAIGLIICSVKLILLNLKEMKRMNKKGYIHPSMYDKNYKEPQSTIDRILHRDK